MIVVSDTSPLTALLTVGQTDILARLFGDVIIPSAVNNELLCHHSHLPVWIRVVAVQNTARAAAFSHIVDRGEAEAIELARELKADRLLIDETERPPPRSAGKDPGDRVAWCCSARKTQVIDLIRA